jgi:hypothetical protein
MVAATDLAGVWVAAGALTLSIVASAVGVAWRLGRLEQKVEDVLKDVNAITDGTLLRDYRVDMDRRVSKLEALVANPR